MFASLANSSNLSTAQIGWSAKKACGYKYFCYKNLIASIYYPEFKTEIWYASKDRDYFYVFHDVNKATKFSSLNFRHKFYGLNNDKYGGTYVGYYTSLKNAKVAADPKLFEKKQKEIRIAEEKKKTKVAKSSSSQSSSMSTDDKITQSKQICRDLGFKTNTEKFADCALKMMSIQFEATNKVAASSGGTKQEIIVKHKNDYDIFDAMIDMSNAMLSNNKKSSSSSSSNNNTRCVIGRTNPTFGTTTMNCR